jgi:hypothetical protein
VSKSYRLDFNESLWEEDLGSSVNATVIPLLKKSTTMIVRKMTSPGNYVEATTIKQDGWAAEESDDEGEGEERYQKVENPIE